MALICPACGGQFDVTLFEYGRRVRCECGAVLDLGLGHTRRIEWGKAEESEHEAYEERGEDG